MVYLGVVGTVRVGFKEQAACLRGIKCSLRKKGGERK